MEENKCFCLTIVDPVLQQIHFRNLTFSGENAGTSAVILLLQ